MVAGNDVSAGPADRVLVFDRVFDAPRALVFKVWTERAHLVRWCAPTGFAITHSEGEVRVGGKWRSCMVSPEGVEHWVGGVYREIEPDRRLVFSHMWEGTDAKAGRETVVKIGFEDEGRRTRMKFWQGVFHSAALRNGHEGGWRESFVRLEKELAEADRVWVLERGFDAPREMVFRAWTEPGMMARWWGPACFTNPVCEMDVRVGGQFRIVMRGADGRDYPFKGEYREVVAPERLVYSNDTSEHPPEWHEMVNPGGGRMADPVTEVTFEARGAGMWVTIRMVFESARIRAGFLKVRMADGWGQSLVKLEELLRVGR